MILQLLDSNTVAMLVVKSYIAGRSGDAPLTECSVRIRSLLVSWRLDDSRRRC